MPSPVLTVLCLFVFLIDFVRRLCVDPLERGDIYYLSSKEVTWTTENPQALQQAGFDSWLPSHSHETSGPSLNLSKSQFPHL